MSKKWIISCESTIDLPYAEAQKRGLPVIFYTYSLDGIEYTDNMERDPASLTNFYEKMAQGVIPTTSQINQIRYYDFFEEQLQKGDLLHIALSSGITPSIRNAELAAEDLRKKYPDRKIVVIDSLCVSCGYALLTLRALEKKDDGATMDEVIDWIFKTRKTIRHEVFSCDLKHYRRSGRISGATATIGTILGICPLIHIDGEGHLVAYSKARGKERAMQTIADVLRENAIDGNSYSDTCWICHSNCPDDARRMKDLLLASFPKIKEEIRIFNIGTIIASHTGPGTVAVFFFGNERTI